MSDQDDKKTEQVEEESTDKTEQGSEQTTERTETTETNEQVEQTEQKEEPSDAVDKDEYDRVLEENRRLKESYNPVTQPTQPQGEVTTEHAVGILSNMSEEDYDARYGHQYPGKTKEEVIRVFKDRIVDERQQKLEARIVVGDALDDAIASNPKLLKLKGSMKEFINEYVPMSDRTNVEKLKKHLAKAETYAKGTYGDTQMQKKPKPINANSTVPQGAVETEKKDTFLGHIKDKESKIKVSKVNVDGGHGVQFDDWG